MAKKQVSRAMKWGLVAVVAVLFGYCVFFVFGPFMRTDDPAKWEETPSGLRVSVKEAGIISGPFNLFSDKASDEWEEWEDYSELKPEDVDVDGNLKDIAELEALDGYVLESGRIFRKESSLMLMLYQELIVGYDVLEDCESALNYFGKFQTIADSENYVVVKLTILPSSLILVFPDHAGYADVKKDDADGILYATTADMKNCQLIKARE